MRDDQTSTNSALPFAKDDRTLEKAQTKHGGWNVFRKDDRFPEGGELKAAGLSSREHADEVIEREKYIVPRTDSTRVSSSRKTFTFDHVSDEIWERLRNGSNSS